VKWKKHNITWRNQVMLCFFHFTLHVGQLCCYQQHKKAMLPLK